jgi:hypothetical protein
MQKFLFVFLLVSLVTVVFFLSCDIDKEQAEVYEKEFSFLDIEGQWSLIQIDTIPSKQSLEVNKSDNSMIVEYETSEVKAVDGILKCVYLCPTKAPIKEIEFANDSVFEYVFPTHLRSSNQLEIKNNELIFKGINSIWSNAAWESSITINLNHDTLRVEYLEHTGLYLSEVYTRKQFDQDLVNVLRAYGHNLPCAHGKYALVHYEFHSVDYDSPFEHYHSFPHAIPETLEFTKAELFQILKDDYEFQMPTDGKLEFYNLSWGWGDSFWIEPKNWIYGTDSCWYNGPDTSSMILYEKIK